MAEQSPFTVELPGTREEVIERVQEALKAEGFGVLTRIDIDDAFREKLGNPFRPYTILGACNPSLAHRALSEAPDIGLFLPCNVTVDEAEQGRTTVRIVDPRDMLGAGLGAGAPAVIEEVADEARERLASVARSLGASS